MKRKKRGRRDRTGSTHGFADCGNLYDEGLMSCSGDLGRGDGEERNCKRVARSHAQQSRQWFKDEEGSGGIVGQPAGRPSIAPTL